MTFLLLPTDIITHVVFPFLTTADLCQIDIAILSHELRPLLHEAFAAFSTSTTTSHQMTACQIAWLIKRGVQFSTLAVMRVKSSAEISAIFEILKQSPTIASHVRHINFHFSSSCVSSQHYSQMMRCCSGLHSLDLRRCNNITRPVN